MEKTVPSGVGIMVMNKEGKVLIGERFPNPKKPFYMIEGKCTWTFPGGKIDLHESIEAAAIRETEEECGLMLKNPKVIAVNNDKDDRFHFITVGLFCNEFEDLPQVKEPDKITKWEWFDLDNLPSPLYLPTKKLIRNYKEKKFYIKN